MSDPRENPRYYELIYDAICWILDNTTTGWETRLGDALNEAIVVVRAVLEVRGDLTGLPHIECDDEPFIGDEVREGLIAYLAQLMRSSRI
jgi:hypothetical protein